MIQSSSSQQKRKRQEYEADLHQESQQAALSQHRASSREMMPPPSSRPMRVPEKAQPRRPVAPSIDAIQELSPMAPRSDRMDSRFTKPEETGYLADISQAPYGLPQRHDEPRHPDDGGMQLQRTGFAAYEDDGMMHYDNQPQGTTRRALQPRQSSDAFDHDSARVGQYEFSNGTACDQRGLPSRALLQR